MEYKRLIFLLIAVQLGINLLFYRQIISFINRFTGFFHLPLWLSHIAFFMLFIFEVLLAIFILDKKTAAKLAGFWKKHDEIIISIFLVLLIIYNLMFMFTSSIISDERQHLHVSYLIAQGKIIYLDFFAHHMPFSYLVNSLFIKIFGETLSMIFILRAFNFILFIASFSFIYKSAKILYNKKVALYTLFFTLSLRQFFTSIYQIRPDTTALFLITLSLYLLIIYKESKYRKSISFFIGLLLMLAFFTHIKTVFFSGVIFLIYLFVIRKNKKLSDLGLFILGAAIISALFFIFLFNTKEKIIRFFLLTIYLNYKSIGGNPVFYNLLTYIVTNPASILLSLYALTDIKLIKKNIALSLLVLGSLVFFIVSIAKGLIGPQYYILIMPFIAVLISLKFEKLERTIKNVRIHSLIIILFLILGLIVPLGAITFDLSRTNLQEEKAELNYFLSFENYSQSSLDEGWFIFHEDANFASFTQNVFMDKLVRLGLAKNESYLQQIETYKPLFVRTVFLEYQIDEIQPVLDRDYNKTLFDKIWVRKD